MKKKVEIINVIIYNHKLLMREMSNQRKVMVTKKSIGYLHPVKKFIAITVTLNEIHFDNAVGFDSLNR